MNGVFEGDEWKYLGQNSQQSSKPTRAQEQARIDTLCATGRMTLDQWRKRTDELSEPVRCR